MKSTARLLLFLSLAATPVCAEPAAPRVLFEEGHGQLFRIGAAGDLDLSLLAGQVKQAGAEVQAIGTVDAAALAGAAALVISGPFQPFRAVEVAAIRAFVEEGGRLAVMLHIGPPAASLLATFGIYHSNGVVRESDNLLEGEPLNFTVRQLAAHPLLAGLDHFAVFGAWALASDADDAILARSGARAWVDLDRDGKQSAGDAVAPFGLVAASKWGAGEVLVFGDDAIFQNRYLRAYNGALGERLAQWLTGRR